MLIKKMAMIAMKIVLIYDDDGDDDDIACLLSVCISRASKSFRSFWFFSTASKSLPSGSQCVSLAFHMCQPVSTFVLIG